MTLFGLNSYNKYFLTERNLLGSQADAEVKARQFKYRLMMDNFCWYNVKHKDKLAVSEQRKGSWARKVKKESVINQTI